jgi:hypothetical protein
VTRHGIQVGLEVAVLASDEWLLVQRKRQPVCDLVCLYGRQQHESFAIDGVLALCFD